MNRAGGRDRTYDTVLLPTDGSRTAEQAADHGIELARRWDANVHALFVIDVAELLELGYVGDRSDFEATIEPLEDEAKRAVGAVRERADERGVQAIAVVRQGDPVEMILEYVDEADVDLIVMGTHGRRGLARHLLGSVTERVLRRATVPVLTVGGPADE